MEQFSLEKYMENPNRKVVTRDGRSVRIVCTDRKFEFSNAQYPVMALIKGIDDGNNNEYSLSFTDNGKENDRCDSNTDLFFAPKKKEKWVNVYGRPDGRNWLGENLYNTEKAARADTSESRVATVKIEWEE